jgi:hypothetical protein
VDLARRKIRDIYGNWVNEDEETGAQPLSSSPSRSQEREESIRLEWRDWIALIIASLQTVLLPIVIFMVVVTVLVALFFHL